MTLHCFLLCRQPDWSKEIKALEEEHMTAIKLYVELHKLLNICSQSSKTED